MSEQVLSASRMNAVSWLVRRVSVSGWEIVTVLPPSR
jgi:hypothetical protein